MSASRTNIFGVPPEFLARWLEEQGEKPFRLKQILDWIYTRRARSFGEMSNLSKNLRERLGEAFALGEASVAERKVSQDGRTVKYLFELADAAHVESVFMPERNRTSVCLSSQTGCGMDCRFCATGAGGAGRNLSGAEIVEQAWRMACEEGEFTHVVFMGMGEPLRNVSAVSFALQALNDDRRFGIGARRMTLSTCGIVSGIHELARAPVPPHLAISLNSPFEDERLALMPGTKKHPLPRVLEAAVDFAEATGRNLTLEYVLLAGVNDTRRHADALAEIAKGLKARVNLIPYNRAEGAPFKSPSSEETDRFRRWLEFAKTPVSIRYRKGRDIAAACGQLKGRR